MSNYAEAHADMVKGMKVAEHAVYYRIAHYHRHKLKAHPHTGRSFPKRRSIAEDLECTQQYITRMVRNLENLGFLRRKFNTFPDSKAQTTNDYIMDFSRWFPIPGHYPKDEYVTVQTRHGKEKRRKWVVDENAVKKERQLLGYFRRAAPNPEAAQELLACWVQIRRRRRDRKKDPELPKLWIAVANHRAVTDVVAFLPEVSSKIEKELGEKFDFRILDTEILVKGDFTLSGKVRNTA